MNNKNIAIILAAGKGRRAGFSIPKQFININGQTVLEHATKPFHNSQLVHEIYIVTNNEYISRVQKMVEQNNFNKVTHILTGGNERHLSTLAALNKINENINENNLKQHHNVIIHDSARILITTETIEQCIKQLQNYQAVTTGSPLSDTIIQINKQQTNELIVDNIPNRNTLIAVQTPQCFHLNTITHAYKIAMDDHKLQTTDDCGIVNKYTPQTQIHVAISRKPNHKLTNPHDLAIIQHLIQQTKA